MGWMAIQMVSTLLFAPEESFGPEDAGNQILI